jgi:serine/threonine-protein kinase
MSQHLQPTVGEELAGYRIQALAGRGGMGEVYRAFDERLGRNVALKVLVPRLADDERFRERFLRESRLAAGIDHPNVIPVYEAGEAEGRLYIAMRYVEGTDLRRVLASEGVLPPARALQLLAPVAGALDTAHARALVHRDVKPGNVLVALEPEADPPEHVYLSDFGLTTLSAEPGDDAPFSGTADYAAPELVTGGKVDGRADQYALGCVLFECLTGEPPYGRESMMSVLWGHVNDPIPAASAANADLPHAIDGVLRKALAKEPDQRYSTCRELVEAARDALGVGGIEVPVFARRRRALVAVALAVALAVVAALLAVFLTRGGGEAPPPATGGAIVRIDPATNETSEPIPIADRATEVGASRAGVWVATQQEGTLWRVDPQTLVVTKIASVGSPDDLAVYGNRLYVAAEGPEIFTGNVVAYEAATGHRIDGVQLLACSITAGAGGVWAAGCPDIQRLSAEEPLRIQKTVHIPYWSPRETAHDREALSEMALGGGSLWVLGDAADRRLFRVDPRSARIVDTFELPFAPAGLAIGEGSVWVVDQLDDVVARIDPETGGIEAKIPIGRGAVSESPREIAASGLVVGGRRCALSCVSGLPPWPLGSRCWRSDAGAARRRSVWASSPIASSSSAVTGSRPSPASSCRCSSTAAT